MIVDLMENVGTIDNEKPLVFSGFTVLTGFIKSSIKRYTIYEGKIIIPNAVDIHKVRMM
jgi:hypothetical protein